MINCTSVVSSCFAADSDGIRKSELFELTDFKVPKITINLSNDDYKRFQLTYQCEYDMNIRLIKRNDECYTAPWVNLDKALKRAFKKNLIDESKLSSSDSKIVNNGNISLSNFENIVTKYSNFTLPKILSTSYGLIDIPDYKADTSLTFELDGYIILNKYKLIINNN